MKSFQSKESPEGRFPEWPKLVVTIEYLSHQTAHVVGETLKQ